MATKNCVKGYKCGKTCISIKRACIVDGLQGQSVSLVNHITAAIKAVNSSNNGLFPDPDSLPPLPPLPKVVAKPEPKTNKTPATQPQFKLPDLDLSKVKPLDKNKTPQEQATDIAKQLKDVGYNGETIVKGTLIMLPENGIISTQDGVITTLNLNSKLVPVLDKIKESTGIYKPFATQEEALEEHSKVKHTQATYKSWGVKEPKDTLKAVKDYTGNYSSYIKMAEAGVDDYDQDESLVKRAELINDFIDKAPPYAGVIYSGFKEDMIDVYQVDKLEVGDEFKFPSITSFSSSEFMASKYAGIGLNKGGMFVVNDNKTASSVRETSKYKDEDEVLTNSTVNYKLNKKYFDNDKQITVYEISEMSRDSNKEYSEQMDNNKQQPKPEKDRIDRWQPVAPLIIKKKTK